MYIPEFICGIAATIIAELVALVIISVVLNARKHGKNE